jgi:hypothetical protein
MYSSSWDFEISVPSTTATAPDGTLSDPPPHAVATSAREATSSAKRARVDVVGARPL